LGFKGFGTLKVYEERKRFDDRSEESLVSHKMAPAAPDWEVGFRKYEGLREEEGCT